MYFLGNTPVEPAGVATTAEVAPTVVPAVNTAPAETPAPLEVVQAAEPTTSITVSLPTSVSTGQPAPVDYSQTKYKKGDGPKKWHRPWNPTPINIIYSDPAPYYFPPYPRDYTEPQRPIYIIRDRQSNINWPLVAGAIALLYLLKG